jgi:uncharacterized small protein (DUF1192 family)
VSDRLALANAIEDAGIERSKAERVASVIFDAIHDNVATKADVQASEAVLRGEIAQTRAELKADVMGVRSVLASEIGRLDTRIERLDATVKAQPNAIMLRLGTLMVVLTGIILAALRYLPPGHSG